MRRIVTRAQFVFTLRIVVIGLLILPMSGVALADSGGTTFSGQATVVKASLPLPPPLASITLADTGPLAASGGSQEVSLLSVSEPKLLTAEVLHAATVGQGDQSRSEASVADVTLTVDGHTVSADFLMSRAMAACGSGGASTSGSSEIAKLTVDNTSIAVSGQPNQTVTLPPLPDGTTGTIVINEQQQQQHQGQASITVNALHVDVTNATLGSTDVVIASAHADITCPLPGAQVTCNGGDFVTGGGYITGQSGAKGNFAVAGGIKQGAFWGHLEYIDHGTGLKVHGTGVTAYSPNPTNPNGRHIEGTADINGTSGTYKVDVVDNGEPGRGTDTFVITLSNGYSAGDRQTLGGGNIQLHKPCQ